MARSGFSSRCAPPQLPAKPPLESQPEARQKQQQYAHRYSVTNILYRLDDVDYDSDEEETALPASLLPDLSNISAPSLSSASALPESFCDIILSDRSHLSDSMLQRMRLDKEAEMVTERLTAWARKLKRVKKQLHRSKLRNEGIRPTDSVQEQLQGYRTKLAKEIRGSIASNALGVKSFETFARLSPAKRVAVYREKLQASGMITIQDPTRQNAGIQTQCIASIMDKHARFLLAHSALTNINPNNRRIWYEAQRHFWRNNVFSADAKHLHTILNALDARTKSYISMLRVELWIEDGYELTAKDFFRDAEGAKTAILQQNQGLRRLVEECYNYSWLKIHVLLGEDLKAYYQEAMYMHKHNCRFANEGRGCKHERLHQDYVKVIKQRVEHLAWMFYGSLRCRDDSVFIDYEDLGLKKPIEIVDFDFDGKELESVTKAVRDQQSKMKAARRQEEQEEQEGQNAKRKEKKEEQDREHEEGQGKSRKTRRSKRKNGKSRDVSRT